FHELSEITRQINLRFEAFNNLLAKHNSLCNLRFFNPTQWEFSGYIDVNSMQVKDASIKELPLTKVNIPPLSLVSLSDSVIESTRPLFKVKESKARISINNGKLHLEVDKKSLSISVKSVKGDVFLRNGNILKIYSDEPGSFDAWEIELDTLNKDNEIKFNEVRVSLDESGRPSIIGKVRLEDNSEIIQTFSLEPESEVVKIQTQILPANRLLLFKTFFKIPNRTKTVTCSVPFGKVNRHTTKTENSMFEFPVLNWLNAESDTGEMAIVSQHLHGYGYTGEGLSLTLAKFPIYPNPWSDIEGVKVSYWLYFHNGNINSNDFNKTVNQLLNPPIVTQSEITEDIIKEKHNLIPSIVVESNSTLVESVRLADSGDHLVIRIYESSGYEDKVILNLSSEFTIYETNIPESSQNRISEKSSTSHTIILRPFEIKTLCLYPRGE
ncbi:MAG: glycosyl hydrolase-related protein, partial [Candidatus Thermoplasmatota archaeon]|nr:glycosyl hydrolase-related protein [Candidatus Thermoplasmatota archaeon]